MTHRKLKLARQDLPVGWFITSGWDELWEEVMMMLRELLAMLFRPRRTRMEAKQDWSESWTDEEAEDYARDVKYRSEDDDDS